MNTCDHCGLKLDFEGTKRQIASQKANHVRWCEKNPDRSNYSRKNKSAVIAMNKAKERLGYTNQFDKARVNGEAVPVSLLKGSNSVNKGRKHTEQAKRKMSVTRQKFLRENPDKHPWKRHDNYVSAPCELLKSQLTSIGVLFEEEYQPLDDRFYSIDIAFPDKKVGLEINGEQHYNRSGTLKKYYKQRHDLIESSGWTLIEINYKEVYSDNLLDKLKNMGLW